jgi:hypothetical protein
MRAAAETTGAARSLKSKGKSKGARVADATTRAAAGAEEGQTEEKHGERQVARTAPQEHPQQHPQQQQQQRQHQQQQLHDPAPSSPQVDSGRESQAEKEAEALGAKSTPRGGALARIWGPELGGSSPGAVGGLEEADSMLTALQRVPRRASATERAAGQRMTFKRVLELCLGGARGGRGSGAGEGEGEDDDYPEAAAEKLLAVKVARLGWQRFTCVAALEALTAIEDLYLEHNLIVRIENLDLHQRIRFLSLGSNRIARIEGISHLRVLELLDLSDNVIEKADCSELPRSLRNLDLSGNPCAGRAGYRAALLAHLPVLSILDDVRVGEEEEEEQEQEQEQHHHHHHQQQQQHQESGGAPHDPYDEQVQQHVQRRAKPRGGEGEHVHAHDHKKHQHAQALAQPLKSERQHEQEENGEASKERRSGAAQHLLLLDRSARTDRRPVSGVNRSDAMMEAAMRKIGELSELTRSEGLSGLAAGRTRLAERSRARMEEHRLLFEQRVRPTLASVRADATRGPAPAPAPL